MKKLFFIVLVPFLWSCKNTNTSIKDICASPSTVCYQSLPSSDSTIPVDGPKTNDNSISLKTRTNSYISQSFASGSPLHDSYGYLLPNGSKHPNDALMWNSVSLATMCMLNGKDNIDLSSEINSLWSTIKTNNFMADGRMIRHPMNVDKRTFSNDMMLGFLYLGAMAKYTNCSQVTNDYLTKLNEAVTYLQNHNYDMQDPSSIGDSDSTTTVMSSNTKRSIQRVLNIYGTTADLGSFGADSLLIQTQSAPWLAKNKYYCRNGYLGSCVRGLNAGIYGNHLFFIRVVIAKIEKIITKTGYSDNTLDEMLGNMAKVGNDFGYPNWLFVSAYRHFNSGTFNDVNDGLYTIFPDLLPSESNTTGWGCTDFIFQRVPMEPCSGDGEVQIGVDFLEARAFTKL